MLVRTVRYAAVAGMLLAASPSATFVQGASIGEPDLGAQSQVERPFNVELPPLPEELVPPPEPAPTEPAPTPQISPPVFTRLGIPAAALAAYRDAADAMERRDPGCNLHWSVLAGIGKVESGHAYGGWLDDNGTTIRPILGVPLNGNGTARISDSDNGQYDRDKRWDRAVGPMQFIPSTWRRWGADGNGDGIQNPSNLYDAALSAGRYLCVGDRDLATTRGLRTAIFSYNHSQRYVDLVIGWARAYARGGTAIPASFEAWPGSASATGPAPGPTPSPAPAAKPAPAKASTQSGAKEQQKPAPSASPSPSPRPIVPAPVREVVEGVEDTVEQVKPVADVLDTTTALLGGLGN